MAKSGPAATSTMSSKQAPHTHKFYIPEVLQQLHSSKPNLQAEAVDLITKIAHDQPSTGALLVAAGAIPPLVKLLSTCSSTMQQSVAAALAALSMHEPNQQVMTDAGVIEAAAQCLTSGNAGAAARAAFILGHIVTNSEQSALCALKVGAGRHLLQMLTWGTTSSTHSSNNSLAELAVNTALLALWRIMSAGQAAAQAVMTMPGCVRRIVQLLGSQDSNMQEDAATAVTAMASNKGVAALVAAGAVPLLVQLLGSSDNEVQEQAVSALLAILDTRCQIVQVQDSSLVMQYTDELLTSGADKASQQVIEAGGVSKLECLMRSSSAAAKIVATGVMLLMVKKVLQQTSTDSRQPPILQIVASAMYVLHSIDQSDQSATFRQCLWPSQLLYNIAHSTQGAAAIVQAGAVPHFVQQLQHSNGKMRAVAVAVLHRVVSNTPGCATACAAIVSAGGIPLLAQLFSSTDAAVWTQVTDILCSLAIVSGSGFIAAGGLAAWHQIHASISEQDCNPSGMVKLQGLMSIIMAVAVRHGCTVGEDAQCMEVLCVYATLSCKLQLVTTATLRGIAQCSRGAGAIVQMMTGMMPDCLVELLSNPDAAVQAHAAGALEGLARHSATVPAIIQAGAVEPLLQLLSSSSNSSSSSSDAGLSNSNFPHSTSNAGRGTTTGHSSTNNAAEYKADMQLSAALALYNMSKDDAGPAAIRDAEGIPALVQLVNSRDSSVQEEVQVLAAGTLQRIYDSCSSGNMKGAIQQAGGKPPFVPFKRAGNSRGAGTVQAKQ